MNLFSIGDLFDDISITMMKNRYIKTENDAAEETPRSPSPEEANRVSSSFIPKSIPVGDSRRQHPDNRTISSSSSSPLLLSSSPSSSSSSKTRESSGRGGNCRIPKTESQHLLRTEPVEIPLRPRSDHVQSAGPETKVLFHSY